MPAAKGSTRTPLGPIIDHGYTDFFIDFKHCYPWCNVGVKYTWFGPGYISNMLFKMIANKPMYRYENGEDKLGLSCAKLRSSWVSLANLREMFSYVQIKLKLLYRLD